MLKNIKVLSLSIENIRCFENTKMLFSDKQPSVIIGANASGKTTILQLIALGLRGINDVPSYYGWQYVNRYKEKNGKFGLEILEDDKIHRVCFQIDSEDIIEVIEGKDFIESLEKENLLINAYGVNRTIPTRYAEYLNNFDSIGSLFDHNDCLHMKDYSSEQKLSREKSFKIIKRVINKIFSQIDPYLGIVFETCLINSLLFKHKNGVELPAESIPESFKGILSWLFDTLIRMLEKSENIETKNVNGIILIDEVDIHLSLTAQRKILPILTKVFPNIQFIVSSNSPFVAQSINENIIKVMTKNGLSETSKLEECEGISYHALIREIFDISDYNIDIEKKLDKIDIILHNALLKEPYDEKKLRGMILSLAKKGCEVEGLLRRKLMSLKHQGIEIKL